MSSDASGAERQFIRHTVGVPIEVQPLGQPEPRRRPTLNVSHGGLAFVADGCLERGTTVAVRIDAVQPPFEARARVVWCRPEGEHYTMGVQFLDASDAFRSRMVQQVCAIEQYRRQAGEGEARELSRGEAAEEWIRKHAASFPPS